MRLQAYQLCRCRGRCRAWISCALSRRIGQYYRPSDPYASVPGTLTNPRHKAPGQKAEGSPWRQGERHDAKCVSADLRSAQLAFAPLLGKGEFVKKTTNNIIQPSPNDLARSGHLLRECNIAKVTADRLFRFIEGYKAPGEVSMPKSLFHQLVIFVESEEQDPRAFYNLEANRLLHI